MFRKALEAEMAEVQGREKRADEKFCSECGEIIRAKAEICPKCGCRQAVMTAGSQLGSGSNRTTAGLLALLLGGLGVHKFYLGKRWWGVLYLLLCWTGIPAIIGLIEGINYLTMSDQVFRERNP